MEGVTVAQAAPAFGTAFDTLEREVETGFSAVTKVRRLPYCGRLAIGI